jgi:hypothetical protein
VNLSNPFTTDIRVLPAERVRSLIWQNDKLVDWVCGVVEYDLNGGKRGPTVNYAYRFDAAIASPSGKFVALYERLGTKVIILGPDRLFREVNRSFYHAEVYEYPILFVRLADGREVLAHCPESYCDLQLEDPTTGVQLTEPGAGRIQSMFHSRLAANAAGNRLLSAGWIWHPDDVVHVFDLKPTGHGRLSLESCDACCYQGAEASSAVFNSAGRVIVASAKDAEDFLEGEPGERLRPGMIGVYDLDQQNLVSLAPLEEEAGTLMPFGERYVVGFFEHPKLIEVATGRVLCRWNDLNTGQQNSSILWHKPLPPPIALDPLSGRFAVTDDKQITVITLSPDLARQ